MKKNFAVSSAEFVKNKPLIQKRMTVIQLDFAENLVLILKKRHKKEVRKQFPFTDCVKLERSRTHDCELSFVFGRASPYKKTVFFQSNDEREQFCNLVHSAIVAGPKAYRLFHDLDTNQDGNIDPLEVARAFKGANVTLPEKQDVIRGAINFPKFLILFASTQKRQEDLEIEELKVEPEPALKPVQKVFEHMIEEHLFSTKRKSLKQRASRRRLSKFAPEPVKTHSALLAGEHCIAEKDHTARLDVGDASRGKLILTNYRLMYRDYQASPATPAQFRPHLTRAQTPDPEDNRSVDAPLGCICRVEKLTREGGGGLVVELKDGRSLSFLLDAESSWITGIVEQIRRMAFPQDQCKTFAFTYGQTARVEVGEVDGWTVYDAMEDYRRIGLADDPSFRVASNQNFRLTDSYPELVLVPSQVSDEDLQSVCTFRSRRRIPVAVWQHPKTKATLVRCSQPLTGVRLKRAEPDLRLFTELRSCNPTNSSTLYIVDARPYKAAVGNTVMGKGFEWNYEGCQIHFLDIDNIHAIRTSYKSLTALCNDPAMSDSTWLSRLEATQWLHYVRLLLHSANWMAGLLEKEGASIVCHCSDGWDRTSQLTALTELLLDPHYRSMKGFAQLVEKEWLSFGHKFAQRFGHADGNFADEQRAPIFLQFIDAVWQLHRQFPFAFEFNERFLLDLCEHVTSCLYGTFLFNNIAERKKQKLASSTVSIWSLLLDPHRGRLYRNPLYCPDSSDASEGKEMDRLVPNVSARRIVFWERCFMRWIPGEEAVCPSLEDEISALTSRLNELRAKVKDQAPEEKQ